MDRHGDYRPLPPELLPPLFVAWDERLSRSSGTVHNVMRYRAAIEHDPAVIEAMARKAAVPPTTSARPSPTPQRSARSGTCRTARPADGPGARVVSLATRVV